MHLKIISSYTHTAHTIKNAFHYQKCSETSSAFSTDEGLRVSQNILPIHKYTSQWQKQYLLSTMSSPDYIYSILSVLYIVDKKGSAWKLRNVQSRTFDKGMGEVTAAESHSLNSLPDQTESSRIWTWNNLCKKSFATMRNWKKGIKSCDLAPY